MPSTNKSQRTSTRRHVVFFHLPHRPCLANLPSAETLLYSYSVARPGLSAAPRVDRYFSARKIPPVVGNLNCSVPEGQSVGNFCSNHRGAGPGQYEWRVNALFDPSSTVRGLGHGCLQDSCITPLPLTTRVQNAKRLFVPSNSEQERFLGKG